jgi:hypothetical protein
MPVRESLLLVLPDKEIYDYLCTGCSSSLGHREVSAADIMMAQASRMGAMGSNSRTSGIPSSFGI